MPKTSLHLYYTHNIGFCQYVFLLDLAPSPLSCRFFSRTSPTLLLTPPFALTTPLLPPQRLSHAPNTSLVPQHLLHAPNTSLAPTPLARPLTPISSHISHALSPTLLPVELCIFSPSHLMLPHPTPHTPHPRHYVNHSSPYHEPSATSSCPLPLLSHLAPHLRGF